MKSKKPGRPKGAKNIQYAWGEPKENRTYKFTFKAHQWIKNHKFQIEVAARLGSELDTGEAHDG